MRFLFPAISLYWTLHQFPLAATPIPQFPHTANLEATLCYLQTSDGRKLDLSSICGKSEVRSQTIYQDQQSSIATANSGILNLSFRATINANPGHPFGRSPSMTQCYIVDTEGNFCQP